MELELRINGVIESLDIAPNESLLTLLRQKGYCSVKHGCETGECGACTVLFEGVPRPSCVMLAAQAGGCSLSTVESLGSAGKLHPLQEAFVEVGAAHCGFCAPGMLLSASALLKRNPSPSEADVRDALSGNLCRCGGYAKPVQAVLRAAARMRGETVPALEEHVVKASEGTHSSGKVLPVLAASASGAGGATLKMPALRPEVIEQAREDLTRQSQEQQFQVVGKSLPTLDALKLVTGKAGFAADVQPRGMLYGRVLTSPHAHARIREIDVSQARALPGVQAVLTYNDVPRVPYSSVETSSPEEGVQDRYCLDPHLRYVGDRVAAVAADTPEIAEQALSLIEVEYEVLPAVLDPRQAVDHHMPSVHPEDDARGIFNASRNIAARVRAEVGDVEQGFAAADLIVEGEYILPPSHPAPLEKHTVVTWVDEDGTLVVRTNCQSPQHVRRTLAHILGLQARHIRVLTPQVGGTADLKQELLLEDIAGLLTLATDRPVLLEYTRADEFRSAFIRSQHIVRMKTGVKRDGTLVAQQVIVLADTGAHGTHPLITQRDALTHALALYPCQHLRFVAEVLYTNHTPATAFQGNGLVQECFALECHMDEVAARLGLDALELRRKNWLKAGDPYPFAQPARARQNGSSVVESCALPSCLQIVEEKLQQKEKPGKQGKKNGRFRHGVGVALTLHGSPPEWADTSGVLMKVNEDGSFDVFVNVPATGSGYVTMLAQVAAETLGVPLSDILMHGSETTAIPFTTGSGDAAVLYGSGNAVKRAAEQVRRQLLSVAGRMLNTLPESLRVSGGFIVAADGQHIPVAQIAQHSFYKENRQIMTTTSLKVQHTPLTFGAHGVAIEVDTETGNIRVLKVVNAVDVGTAINPQLLSAQIQGSTVQALGLALTEELLYDQQGAPLTTNLSEYRLFAAPDVPTVQSYLVEAPDPAGPFGAKAAASMPMYGIAPALANAVADAIGVRIRQLPLTPERMLRAIHAQMHQRT